jgi:hypothetical protein
VRWISRKDNKKTNNLLQESRLSITSLTRFHFRNIIFDIKSGPLSPHESAAPILVPIPRHPSEVGADISTLICALHKLKYCFLVIVGSMGNRLTFALSPHTQLGAKLKARLG